MYRRHACNHTVLLNLHLQRCVSVSYSSSLSRMGSQASRTKNGQSHHMLSVPHKYNPLRCEITYVIGMFLIEYFNPDVTITTGD
uniref:Uncharacterized protein n=1 Tax=Anguilla anguilla TaxID=7936 RepID=A0A0E9W2H2_ANGAN